MSIQEVQRKTGKRYRANVYTKEKRILGEWRKTKKHAQLDEVDIKNQVNTGTYIEETAKTLDECATIYFEVVAVQKMSASSIELEKSHYKNHIKPVFGHRNITSIKPYEIQKLWTDKLETHATSTINRMHTIMNKIYKQFIKWEEIKHNPMENVDKPRVTYAKTEVWNKKEVRKFLLYAKEYQYYIVFINAIYTGMRIGEILALHWSDIDFENKVISVTESLNRKHKKRGPLKTESSKRLVTLDEGHVNILRNHKKLQNPKSEIVCASSNGTYLDSGNVRRAMKAICEEANIKRIRVQDLRHTHATLLGEIASTPKIIQERLGHADSRITLERYTHVSSELHVETAKRFQALLNENS